MIYSFLFHLRLVVVKLERLFEILFATRLSGFQVRQQFIATAAAAAAKLMENSNVNASSPILSGNV